MPGLCEAGAVCQRDGDIAVLGGRAESQASIRKNFRRGRAGRAGHDNPNPRQ